MTFEINNVFTEYLRSKDRQWGFYRDRAFNNRQESLLGYVADVDETNRLTNTYNVVVPELNNTMLRRIPRTVPDGFAQANGVGHNPPPLRPGQPVVVRFNRGRSSLPYIDGSVFLNGNFDMWAEGRFPAIDDRDDITNLALWHAPVTPELLAAGGQAEITVHPLILRTQSPVHGTNSAAGLEVPGTTYIHDDQGNVYSNFMGQQIIVGRNEIEEIAGSRESLVDRPMNQAVQAAALVQANIVEELAHWRTAVGGQYQIQSPHPSSSRTRTSLSTNNNGIAGALEVPTGFRIQTAEAAGLMRDTFSKIDSVINLLNEASEATGLQLDFLQKTVLPLVNRIKSLWGSFNGFGLTTLSLEVALPLNLKLSASISFNWKTGKLNIAGSIGFGGASGGRPGTLITGSQPLPLRSEGKLIAGGFPRTRNPEIIIRQEVTVIEETSVYLDYSLEDYPIETIQPALTGDRLPYNLVSSDLNQLDFAKSPELAVASLLINYGVADAPLIIRYLAPLIRYGSLFDFLKLAAVLARPLDSLLITIGLLIEGDNDEELIEVITLARPGLKPSSLRCPPVPEQIYDVLRYAKERQLTTVEEYINNYLLADTPNYTSWFIDLDNFIDWLYAQKHPLLPALDRLAQGDITGFLVLLIYLKTGNDIRAYPRSFDELLIFMDRAFPLPKVGAV